MAKALSLQNLNRFLEYPYVVMGYKQYSNENTNPSMRTYSLYQMRNHSLLELVPLPIQFIEETEMIGNFQSARLIYQNCILSGEWGLPFSRGCVKLTRELVPALTELGVLKPQYFEALGESDNLRSASRVLLRSLGDCAYDMLEPDYIIKRGNGIMSKNGTAVLEPETGSKPKTSRGNTKMSALYGLIRQDEATGESLNTFEWYLSKQFGSIEIAVYVLKEFNAHLNASTFTIPGIDKELSVDHKVAAMRALGVSEGDIEDKVMEDREEAAGTFDLEKAIAKAKTAIEKSQKAAESVK